jgi:group II intron reverse transcriptase/maturase
VGRDGKSKDEKPEMNEHEKSEHPIVPAKPPNKGTGTAPRPAEVVEGRGWAKGNPSQGDTSRTQSRVKDVPSALERIRQAAEKDKGERFTALYHHIYDPETLRRAYLSLKREAAPGVDGQTWRAYGEDLEGNLGDLSERLKRGAYRAKPVRRVYIPKADGRQRPIGVTTVEDKIVQRAAVEVLNAVYETDFVGYSYGFRPGKSPHNALDALWVGLTTRKVSWVLDADIRGYFDAIDHGWLVKFIEHRIGDRRVVRLIQKWLRAGVLEDGARTRSETGTPQGGSASPLLANVYLHYVFDLWVGWWRRKQAHGDVIVVRFADDFIVGFERQEDGERFLAELRARFAQFNLELHPEKTRLIEFGRYAAERRARRGEGKPETFDFLGFTHICSQRRDGRFTVKRKTARDRMRRKLKEVRAELRRRMHDPVPEVGAWLGSVVRGHVRYYGVPSNSKTLWTFRYRVLWLWRRVASRRSQKGYVTWDQINRWAHQWIPSPRVCHPYPNQRLRVRT